MKSPQIQSDAICLKIAELAKRSDEEFMAKLRELVEAVRQETIDEMEASHEEK